MAQKTATFFGASTGVGLFALKHSLAAGVQCIALCRTPSKLTAIFPAGSTPNLTIVQGNAHDVEAVSKCIAPEGGRFVDEIISTIGGKFDTSKFTIDDAQVCEKGMDALLAAISQLRAQGATGNPRISVCSTTGMSKFGRDTPLVIVPLYNVLLKVPHKDKRLMEDKLAASGEAFTVVRATWLTNGAQDRPVRVGIEDHKNGVEKKMLGYSISREDAGQWFADNLVLKSLPEYTNKTVTISF